jgi:hypothetical protein
MLFFNQCNQMPIYNYFTAIQHVLYVKLFLQHQHYIQKGFYVLY